MRPDTPQKTALHHELSDELVGHAVVQDDVLEDLVVRLVGAARAPGNVDRIEEPPMLAAALELFDRVE
jgi:uncharacterized membrane protein